MDIEIKLDPDYTNPKIIVLTSEVTPQVTALVEKLSSKPDDFIVGYDNDQLYMLDPNQIIKIYSENQKIFAQTNEKTFNLKSRLYELEDQLIGSTFVRISNSEIVNFKYVESLDMSISGSLLLKLNNKDIAYVSRRYIKTIKDYLKI